MVVNDEQVSRASPFLYKIPRSAPIPVPTMMAVGVARPRAQGQATKRTAVKTVREKGSPAPAMSHMRAAVKAIIITVGTKMAETLSARRAIGAREA